MSSPAVPIRFTIALCTCNGAAHLQDQLDSYLVQDHTEWDLWVSDDGSSDGTLVCLEAFASQVRGRHAVRVLNGPRRGAAGNFLSLLCHPELPPGPVALSDQDDVWFPHKLSAAARALEQGGPVTLYGAQSRHVDASLRWIGSSRPPRRTPEFTNALTQNVVSGHSAVLSAEALALVRRAGLPRTAVPYHDWWLSQLISGAGGDLVVSSDEVLFYRQHGSNVMGAHRGPGASARRLAQVFGRSYGDWLEANWSALEAVSDLLQPQAQEILARLKTSPRGTHIGRVRAFAAAGLHRQTSLSQAALYLAALLGRI